LLLVTEVRALKPLERIRQIEKASPGSTLQNAERPDQNEVGVSTARGRSPRGLLLLTVEDLFHLNP